MASAIAIGVSVHGLPGVMSSNAEQENIFLYTELVAMCTNNWNCVCRLSGGRYIQAYFVCLLLKDKVARSRDGFVERHSSVSLVQTACPSSAKIN